MSGVEQAVATDHSATRRPASPAGEEQACTNRVLDLALDHVMAALDELRTVAMKEAAAAPTSSRHVEHLIGLIALDTLAWIEAWPS